MLSRRSFFRATSVAAVSAALPAIAEPDDAASLPAPIAALPSFAGRVPPFTNEERLARIERAKALMAENHIDAIVLANNSTSSMYFANISLNGGERLWALVIPAKAMPFLVCPGFENARAHELLSNGPFGSDADVLTWQEDESPFALLVRGLRDRGIATGRVGLDENMKYVFSSSLAQAGPQLTFVIATPVTAGCRMIKDAHEIECMRMAGAATLAVYEAVYRSLREGMTTTDVHRLMAAAYEKVGLAGEASLNIGDVYRVAAWVAPGADDSRRNDADGGRRLLWWRGITSDITRTFVLGKPTEKMNQVFDSGAAGAASCAGCGAAWR